MSGKILIVMTSIVLVLVLGPEVGFGREKEAQELSAGEVLRELDKILNNQDEIFKQLEEIKQELAVIKVRASRR